AGLAADLRLFLSGKPIQARPARSLEQFWRWCRRKPLVAGQAAGLLLVFGAGFAGVTWQWRQAEASRELAEDNFQQAYEAMTNWSSRSEEELARKAGMQPLRCQLLTE